MTKTFALQHHRGLKYFPLGAFPNDPTMTFDALKMVFWVLSLNSGKINTTGEQRAAFPGHPVQINKHLDTPRASPPSSVLVAHAGISWWGFYVFVQSQGQRRIAGQDIP